MSVRHNRLTLLQLEYLVAEDQVGRQPLDFRELEADRPLALVAEGDLLSLLKVDELQEVGQVDAGHQFLDLLLPGNLFQLVTLQIAPQLVEILDPLGCNRLQLVGQRLICEQRFQQ